MVQAVAPAFRLIRAVEPFPKLSGKTETVFLKLFEGDLERIRREGSPPAIAAIHERKSGKPLASCALPCTMQAPVDTPTMVTVYRYGSNPAHYKSTRYSRYKKLPLLYLGFNEVDYQVVREECAYTFSTYLNLAKDRETEPCYRLPPLMPSEALESGHCIVSFDVSEYGETLNVLIEECTDSIFCEASMDSVSRWIYHPSIQSGKAVKRFAVESKITFRLASSAGELIPEPENPMMELCIGSV